MPDPTETAKPVPPLEPGRIHEHSGRRVGGVETVPGGPHPDAGQDGRLTAKRPGAASPEAREESDPKEAPRDQ